jgi:tRNA (cytidine32/uridine32-2'-O)-methyltransferase
MRAPHRTIQKLRSLRMGEPSLPSPLLAHLPRIRVVLVGTTLARNIGAAARAMKVMGLQRLYLVNPRFFPDPDATALAAGADDVLENAVVLEDLASAVADCVLVLGTSARRRDIVIPEYSPARAAQQLLANAEKDEVALVFGSERVGLDNRELLMCQGRVQIPTDPEYSSLNLASAVQLMSYEIRLAALADTANVRDVAPLAQDLRTPAPAIEFERLMTHYAEMLKQINFYSTKNPEKLLTRLRRLFQRAELDQREVQILRGILSETQRMLSSASERKAPAEK